MMEPMKTRLIAPLCASLLMALASAPALADINRDAAVAVAQRATGGRVLSVDKAEAGKRPVWRVKVVTAQGEVKIILIDAVTGQPM